MKIIMKLTYALLIVLIQNLTSCALNPELEPTTNSNLFERSSIEVYEYKFFETADKNDFTSCIGEMRPMCEDRYFEPGRPFEALEFTVTITDRGTASAKSSMSEYSMFFAGSLAKKYGLNYFTIVNVSDIGGCSSNPSSSTFGNIDSNGSYMETTNFSRNSVCANLYKVTYIAFNDYEPIKSGILIKYAENKKAKLHYDLYFNLADKMKATNYNRDPDATKYYFHHPVNAWKSYFPAEKTILAVSEKLNLSQNLDVMKSVRMNTFENTNKNLKETLLIQGK